MPTLLKDLIITKVALVDEGSCSEAYIKLAKRKENGGKETMNFDEILKGLTPEQQEIVKAKLAEVAKDDVVKAKDTEIGNLKTELEKAKSSCKKVDNDPDDNDDKDDDDDDMMKSLPQAIKDIITKSKLQEKIAQEELRKVKEQEESRVALEKAKELKNIPVAEDTLVSVIKSLDGNVKSLVIEVLEKANKAIAGSELLKNLGSDEGSTSNLSEDQAWAEIEKAAEPIALAKSISKEQAISEVINTQPALYKKYTEACK